MMFLRLIFHFISLIVGSYGFYYFDLFASMNMDSSKIEGTTNIEGPERGSTAINFGPNTGDIKLTSEQSNDFAYILHTISTSNDFTFATRFKITVPPNPKKSDGQQLMSIFSLQQSNGEDIWFSIGFKFVEIEKRVEDVVITGEEHQYVSIGRWKEKGKDKVVTEIEVVKPHSIKTGVWQTLMVRIRGDQATINIDCKDVATQTLDGIRETYKLSGFLTMSQTFEAGAFGGTEIKNRFLGALYEPEIYNGDDAFQYFNPCTADKTPSFVPSEPRPQDYNPAKFNRFTKMVANADTPVNIFCNDGGMKKVSGDSWNDPEKPYNKKKCNNGVVTTTYIGPICSFGGQSYKDGDKWITPDKLCLQRSCVDGSASEDTITCTKPICDAFGIFTDPKECCPKCYRDSCTNGKKYYEGCERKCGIASDFQCKSKTAGCWCPEKTALNEVNQCVPLNECNCSVGTKLYLPGQAVVRSSCQTCICANGEMRCTSRCSS